MLYDLIESIEDIKFEGDARNLEQITETVDEEHGGDVLSYIDDLIDVYLYNIDNIDRLRQYLVYLDVEMRYFTLPCKHYALERLFENLKLNNLK